MSPLSAAEITGKVTLKGTPKPEIPILLDQSCSKLHSQPITTRHYVLAPDGGLGNVFVYLKTGAPKMPPPKQPVVVDQVDCLFQPFVVGAMVGQKVVFRNSDPLLHNVHVTPKVNKELNLAQPFQGQQHTNIFEKPEVLVRVKCDVHPWMFAYIGVLEHPFYAVTDKTGAFRIANVPAGKYTIEAYHLKAGAKAQELTLASDDKKTVAFELEVPAQ